MRWYAARLVMYFQRKEGLQRRIPAWANIVLIRASSEEEAFAKARGVGDCGSAATWAWDGHAFRLLRETVMEPCRRVVSEDWPTLYVTQRK